MFAFALFSLNVYLSMRCGAWTLFWAAVSLFAPFAAMPILLYWNVMESAG